MSEAILLRIDEPEDRVLRNPMSRIRGWCAIADGTDAAELELRFGDARVPWRAEERPDVRDEHPELWVKGFILDLDMAQYLYAIGSEELFLSAALPRGAEEKVTFTVPSGLAAKCLAAAADV